MKSNSRDKLEVLELQNVNYDSSPDLLRIRSSRSMPTLQVNNLDAKTFIASGVSGVPMSYVNRDAVFSEVRISSTADTSQGPAVHSREVESTGAAPSASAQPDDFYTRPENVSLETHSLSSWAKVKHILRRSLFWALVIFFLSSLGNFALNIFNLASPNTYLPVLDIYYEPTIAGIIFNSGYVIAYLIIIAGMNRNPDPVMRFLNEAQAVAFMSGFGLLIMSQIASIIKTVRFNENRRFALFLISVPLGLGASLVALGIVTSSVIGRMVRQMIAAQSAAQAVNPTLPVRQVNKNVAKILALMTKIVTVVDICRYIGALALLVAAIINIGSIDLRLLKYAAGGLYITVSCSFIVVSVVGMIEYLGHVLIAL